LVGDVSRLLPGARPQGVARDVRCRLLDLVSTPEALPEVEGCSSAMAGAAICRGEVGDAIWDRPVGALEQPKIATKFRNDVPQREGGN
jgi:hypothetical protein